MTRNTFLLGLTATVFAAGCVQPDPERPWSTRAESAGGSPEEVILARPVEPVINSVRVLDRAIECLRRAANDEHPLLRATAFEGLEYAPELFVELAPSGLSDPNRGVRFVTAMTAAAIGDSRLTPFLTPLILDESLSVQAAAMFALHELGQPVDFTPLSTCVMVSDPEVRANGYFVLGRLGNPSAMPLIEASLQQDVRRVNLMRLRMAELQGAGALVRLGRERMIEPIRAALFAPPEQAERTLLACDLLGELGDEGARPMLVRIVSAASPPYRALEVQMAAAKALLTLAPPYHASLVELLFRGLADDDPRRRLQAVTALGAAKGPEIDAVLGTLLDDPDPMVATVAAGAVVAREPDRRPVMRGLVGSEDGKNMLDN